MHTHLRRLAAASQLLRTLLGNACYLGFCWKYDYGKLSPHAPVYLLEGFSLDYYTSNPSVFPHTIKMLQALLRCFLCL